MLFDFRSIAIVAICASAAAACTGTPRTAEPAPRTVALAPPAPLSRAVANPTPAAASTIAAAPASDVDASLVKSGYSVMRRRGQVFYCRNEIITGQRLGTRVCLTAAQIQSEKQNMIKAKDLLSGPGDRCLKACVH